tara:strand:+ start:443 stop:625 length:183 start_codon:yes stop_codon:yes gene_type:complete
MAFPTSPSDRDYHTENDIKYIYSTEKEEWYRANYQDAYIAIEKLLTEVESLKARVTALEG